jgi:hypothetical protein
MITLDPLLRYVGGNKDLITESTAEKILERVEGAEPDPDDYVTVDSEEFRQKLTRRSGRESRARGNSGPVYR